MLEDADGIFSAIRRHTTTVPDDQIIAAMDPWTLACAVGAENGTVGVHMGFEPWLHLSKKNWLPKVKAKINTSDSQIESALRQFVETNKHRHMNEVMCDEETKRGEGHSPVLGPGESMTVSIQLNLKD